jgi:UDP-4-amino-4,6-dideoxy-N-acetyl-beta-L-altrosamine transaminase
MYYENMGYNFLPYSKPEISEEEIGAVINTLKSGWLTTGPKTKEFEIEFGNYFGKDDLAIAVNSATSGLHLALEALGIKSGDEVITTTHTFTATAEVIRYLGANPIFIDIDPKTLCIDPQKIEEAITDKTKAIIPVHFAGLSADIDKINKIAKKYNLSILEDAAHALPTTYKGKKIGSLNTDITVFSFYANKTLTTGEGGMVITKNKNLAERIKLMRSHGINREPYDRFSSSKPKWFYEVIAPGFKYNMTDISAALGLVQLKKVNKMQEKREEIAAEYYEKLKDLAIELPPKPKNGDLHSWHLFVIQLKNSKVSRNDLINKLFENGIGCSVHYIPLHLHPYWRDKYKLSKENFPVSQKIYENSISLPIYSMMTEKDTQRVIVELKKYI